MPARDQRDPSSIGRAIMFEVEQGGCKTAASAADFVLEVDQFPDFDGRYPGPLERYGDPRAIHDEGSNGT